VNPVFSTRRLIVRRWVIDDAASAFRLYGDARVWAYIGGGSGHSSIDVSREWLQRVIDGDAAESGLGCWAIVDRASNRAIGAALLVPFPGTDEIEIGYHLAHDAWGHGFATEVAVGLVRYGFVVLGLARIIAVASPDNLASRRVLEQAGLTGQGTRNYHGTEKVLYIVDADQPSPVMPE